MTRTIVPADPSALGSPQAYREALGAVREEIAKARPLNTQVAYASDWRKFRAWCEQLSLPYLPTTEEAVTGYMTHLALMEKRKPSTIQRRLFGIAHHHSIAAKPGTDPLPSPITKAVRDHLRNLRRQPSVNTRRKEAPPLMLPELLQLVAYLDQVPAALQEVALRDKAVLLLGWNCAFRRSEVTALETTDLIRRGTKRFVLVGKSKTDQEGAGVELPLNTARKHPTLCPLRAIDAWIEFRGDDPGALFWKISERTCKKELIGGSVLRGEPMPWFQVNRLMVRWSKMSGIQHPDEPRYSPHSLRAGFITETALAGELPSNIMARSRHKSLDVFHRYIRIALDHANDPAMKVI